MYMYAGYAADLLICIYTYSTPSGARSAALRLLCDSLTLSLLRANKHDRARNCRHYFMIIFETKVFVGILACLGSEHWTSQCCGENGISSLHRQE